MEFPFISTCHAIFIFIFFFYLITKRGKKSKTKKPAFKCPPGPWRLPIVGNIHQLVGLGAPHVALCQLAKEHGPLMRLQLGEVSALIVSSPKAAKVIMKTHDLIFSDRPEIIAAKILSYGCKSMVFAPYGNYWREIRKICVLELLSLKRVQMFSSVREEELSKLVTSISSSVGSPINLSNMILSLTNDIVSRAAFGNKCVDKEEFFSILDRSLKFADGFDLADLFPSVSIFQWIARVKLQSIFRKLDKVLDNMIQAHKDRKGESKCEGEITEGLVDVLLRVQERRDFDFSFSMESLKSVILDMFGAGTETSSNVLDWAMAEMTKNPQIMAKAQAEVRHVFKGKTKIDEKDIQELNYLKLVIKETLRLHPPLPLLLPRQSRETCEIDGYEIPKNTKVIINAWAIGRDPQYWNEPERFCPERFNGSSIDFKGSNFEFIPFGSGRRMCAGMAFGLATIESALANLLYYFNWSLPVGVKPEDLDMAEKLGITAGRKCSLYLHATPHFPLPTS